MGKKKACAAGIVAAVVCAIAIWSCAPATSNEDASSQSGSASGQTASGTTETAAYAELFPLQYNSLYQTRVNAKGITIGHNVDLLRDICEAPLLRDQNGDVLVDENGNSLIMAYEYNAEIGQYVLSSLDEVQLDELGLYSGCVACKSSKFNALYDEMGAMAYGSVYNDEARAVVNSEYYDCAMCHTGTPSASTLSANLVYFQALGEGLTENLDTHNAICAQCHNSYDYRSSIKTEEDLATFRPYRYGYDIESLFEAAYEDGVNFDTDETTGISESYVVHPTIELFMGSKHQKMGVTCTSCHMPTSTDTATGAEYTNHFAANSPIQSEDSLTYCLTCHSAYGIASTDDMAAFVQGKEAEMAAGMEALEARMTALKGNLEAAISSAEKDEATLVQARKLFAKVSWCYMCMVTGPYESAGSQVAMMDWEGILRIANTACDDAEALLA